MAWPELIPGAASPLIAADGYMLYRMISTGPLIVLDFRHAAQRHHAPALGTNLELGQVVDLLAKIGLTLNVHLPCPAKEVEVVDVERAQDRPARC